MQYCMLNDSILSKWLLYCEMVNPVYIKTIQNTIYLFSPSTHIKTQRQTDVQLKKGKIIITKLKPS